MISEIIRKKLGPKLQKVLLTGDFLGKQNSTLRKRKHSFLSKSMKQSAFVLDCGCGDGKYTYNLKPFIDNVVGIDVSKCCLQRYRQRIGREKTDVILASLENLPIYPAVFDSILLLDCLEHSQNPYNVLKQVFNLLHTGGFAIITAPNWYNRFLDDGVIGHQHFYSSIAWIKLVKHIGFYPIQKTCLGFPVTDHSFFRSKFHFLGFWVAILVEKPVNK